MDEEVSRRATPKEALGWSVKAYREKRDAYYIDTADGGRFIVDDLNNAEYAVFAVNEAMPALFRLHDALCGKGVTTTHKAFEKAIGQEVAREMTAYVLRKSHV